MIEINIAKDFTNKPGGRYIKEGDFSGEQFRKTLLLPKYNEAKAKGEKLLINLDDCYGYATSFLEEAFGGLARELKNNNIFSDFRFISEDEPALVDLIKKYIESVQ